MALTFSVLPASELAQLERAEPVAVPTAPAPEELLTPARRHVVEPLVAKAIARAPIGEVGALH